MKKPGQCAWNLMIWKLSQHAICALILSAIVLCGAAPGGAQILTKGPYLVAPGATEMKIRWETDTPAQCAVRYGLDSTRTQKKAASLRAAKAGGFLYEAVLDGLKPGSRHFYQVNYGKKKSAFTNFTTFAEKQPAIHFVAMGDSRSNPDIFASIITALQSDAPDVIISMGDLVASGGDSLEWKAYYFEVAKKVIDHIPLVSTLGDHEGDDDNGELFRHFLRTTQPTEKLWFSFDYGDAHFVSLDYRHPDSEEMADWFVRDMSASTARWKFVFFHRPCYNLGGHRSTWGRDRWPALFREHRVDIVFAGHSHQYERFFPMRPQQGPGGWPVTYVTTGGAGAELYEVTQHPSLAKAASVNHFVDVVISGDTLNLKAIRNDHSLLDELAIIKKGDGHDPAYLAMVQSQENVDLLTNLTGAITLALDYVPFEEYAAPCAVTLKSCVNEDVPFRIELAEQSGQAYKMEPVTGTLKAGEEKPVTLEIYSKTEFINISNWGEMSPELRLKLSYTFGSREETIIGGRAEYWPSIY